MAAERYHYWIVPDLLKDGAYKIKKCSQERTLPPSNAIHKYPFHSMWAAVPALTVVNAIMAMSRRWKGKDIAEEEAGQAIDTMDKRKPWTRRKK